MNNTPARIWMRAAVWALGLIVETAVLVLFARHHLPAQTVCPDFIAFWTAGELLRNGKSPYDVAGQTQVQHEYGWDKDKDGVGRYDFLPYYYPPWLGILCIALLPLGYETARITWFVAQIELLVLSGFLLRKCVGRLPQWVLTMLVPLFAYSLLGVLLGQITPLILFLVVAAWRLLEAGWDRAAGGVLAALMTKPQLTIVLIPAVLIWALKRQRLGVLIGFLTGIVVLGLGSACLVPDWPLQMLRAPALSPLVTNDRPWMSTTWYSLLQTFGLTGWSLWAMYTTPVVMVIGLILRTIRRENCSLDDVLALGILAPFFIVPYARAYDQALLIIPMFLLIGRVSPRMGDLLLAICFFVPFIQLYWLAGKDSVGYEVAFFWTPLFLGTLWIYRNPLLSNPLADPSLA